jgi:pyrroline-5-carboxylate reductase
MTSSPITFIGGGNMARSLIAGLVRKGVAPDQIHVAEPVAALRTQLTAEFGVNTYAAAADAAARGTAWVLAVKPQVLREVCAALTDVARTRQPLVVSIAAGITSAQLVRWLGGHAAIVRAMPNTPALLGAGVTGLFATGDVSAGQRSQADAVLASAGRTVWIDDEARMDAVTAVSGSGPAYVFLLAEAMEAAGIAQGLPADAARTLVVQTLLGASRMLDESGEAPAELRRRVTSPNGTTQAAIESFQGDDFEAIVGRAIDAATRRGQALSAAND